MIRIRTIDGPEGPVHIAAGARGIVAVETTPDADAFTALVRRRLRTADVLPDAGGPSRDRSRDHLDAAEHALRDLWAGRPPAAVPPIDLHDRPAWDQAVLGAVAGVPWGETVSYAEIARRVGRPGAARAVGGAMGRNPVAWLIPCHRVIAADGTLGGYGIDGWGSAGDAIERKRSRLRREGVIVGERAR